MNQHKQAMDRIAKILPSSVSVSGVAGGSNVEDTLAAIPKAPLDPILGTKVRFLADKSPDKINLGIGAYRTDDGKPYVLRVVREAEKMIFEDQKLDHEYLGISGLPAFKTAAQSLLFGQNHAVIKEKRVCTTQALSGTGALRIGAEFISKHLPGRTVYVSDPTWGNHLAIFKEAHVQTQKYRYWDANTRGLNFQGMLEDINKAANGSVFLLHACAHNPTGVDPTHDQWKEFAAAIKAKGHVAFFDVAYQGFASGDLDHDGAAMRYFADQGIQVFVSQSFAKNLGLYGERIGSFNVVCKSEQMADAILSQIELIIRPMYSNPPAHGARIVSTVVNSPQLFSQWNQEMKEMSSRIITCRGLLLAELKKLGTPGDWTHITSQIGMFSYTGLSVKQCNQMIEKWHVYMLTNGRISMAGVNTKNVAYLAKAIDDCARS